MAKASSMVLSLFASTILTPLSLHLMKGLPVSDLLTLPDAMKYRSSNGNMVAQLTTKIKHLSSALHKKDKHSIKGLQAMVQRRKRILKYLRRTDWDSYCLVLSKLGLRDNPNYKH
ncbi:30s ribosomal protein s15 [Quercus suber]|uniref:30s ribosomal protein s15 n=1 Tax=Quercus suber TaxID=58331 RepID=A0AAW0L8W7_QUESU